MTEPTELLPCPFCGSPDVAIADDLVTFNGLCNACGASGGYSSYRNGATWLWNRRTLQPTQAQAGAITPPPIECNTEELKRAYAFGWWSALEKQRETAQAGAVPLTVSQIRDWWESETGIEDCDMCRITDFLRVVRAVEERHGIKGGQHG